MGCAQSQSRAVEEREEPGVQYGDVEEIEIKEYAVDGSIYDIQRVLVSLTVPVVLLSQSVSLSGRLLAVSSCVLPGLDPRGTYAKACQDGLCTLQSPYGLLVALMDGHGTDGEKVVSLALAVIAKEFAERALDFETDSERAITELMHKCDKHVKETQTLNCAVSGSTAILIYINSKGIHVGSVGDSRAIMGVVAGKEPPSDIPQRKANRHFKQHKAARSIGAVQLTLDQKPNHVGEMDRIMRAGGRVSRIIDEYGKAVGPYRVWQRFGTLPGLAMSRSIGDKIAGELGVIATPVYNSFPFYSSVDLFIVVASDGVWDAMSNQEVANFVEKHRKVCPKTDASTRIQGKLHCNGTNIAHFLCEEARYRWLGICEEEDVMIDDISCTILEFPPEPFSPHMSLEVLPDRSVGRTLSLCERDDPSMFLKGKHVDSRGTLVDNSGPDAFGLAVDQIGVPAKSAEAQETNQRSPSRRQSKPPMVRNDLLRGSVVQDTTSEAAQPKPGP